MPNLYSIHNIANIFYSNTMAYIASGCVGFMFIAYSVYNGYFYIFKPEKYKGIRFTTKNIAYITMLSATSVTVTIIVSVTFPITVFPPVRIAFEGLMVKITGFIFGPIVGMLSGCVTDGLALLFVPSYIHISYLIVIASYGFLSGLISSLYKSTKENTWFMYAFTNVFILMFAALACFMTYFHSSNSIPLFSGIIVTKMILIYTILVGTLSSIVILTAIIFVYRKMDKTKSKWQIIVPIIALAIVNEYWITTLISAWGDIAFLTASSANSSKNYGLTMIGRLAMAPIKIIFNIIVIYITYRAIHPLIDKD